MLESLFSDNPKFKNLRTLSYDLDEVKKDSLINNTAILFFDHSKKQEATLRLIAPRIDSNAVKTVLGSLRKQALSLANQTNFPVFEFHSEGEKEFGLELYEAYQSIFSLGYNAVVAIGNDCPTLEVDDILLAAKCVSKDHLVLGPALDGGTYLIGIHKDTFSQSQFLNLDWQQPSLLDSFDGFVKENNKSCLLLSPKGDMDTPEEFRNAFHSHIAFLDFARSIVASFQFQLLELKKCILLTFPHFQFSLRGPPVMM